MRIYVVFFLTLTALQGNTGPTLSIKNDIEATLETVQERYGKKINVSRNNLFPWILRKAQEA